MKITKEAIHTDTEALASKMAGLTDAVADAPSEWKDEDNQPDWDNAPEGATHWNNEEKKWMMDDVFMHVFEDGKWLECAKVGGWNPDELIPRPEQSKSTEQDFESFVTECLIIPRDGDGILFHTRGLNGKGMLARLHRYAILPIEEFEILEAKAELTAKSEPQEQEWEDGKPPIGKECEKLYDQNKDIYYRVSIIAYDGSSVIYRWHEGDKKGEVAESWCSTNSHGQDIFRPIQSTAERKRKEFVSELLSLDFSMDECSLTDIANGIYDWLIDNDMLKDDE